MFSSQPQTKSIQAPEVEIADGDLQEQQSRELSDAGERPRRGRAFSGRRLAVAAAVAVGVASGSAAIITVSSHTPQATTHGLSTGASARVFPLADASSASQHRLVQLEARGYKDVACKIDGELLFNPHTQRYVTVRA